ncbi:WD40-repeat-containing domain protein [Jimgerdemannia flammicorona]|uniref:WD40-repeat-containing domain protein n=1 Tax=Jimgerdemannia flammicorona TaxID=994334 RepID=A0A433QX96_9FUNG|nr:WD40-repeat-containing domain protein [Jimgerdemannia flammicorona]
MNQITRFDTQHTDLVHDIAYDYYGKRLVTCSSDQRLKVWDFNDEIGAWEINDDWKAHDSSIIKVSWAHPEYGQIIASCSFDRIVKIWEEQEFDHPFLFYFFSFWSIIYPTEAKGSQKRWAEKARLTESRGSVRDIAFSPRHMGLKLATCAADGFIHIYEAMEVTKLSQWAHMDEFEILSSAPLSTAAGAGTGGSLPLKETESNYCFSWYPGKVLSPMMVVGCGKENCAKIFKFDSTSSPSKWFAAEVLPGHENTVHDVVWAPNMGRSYQLIATACKDHHVRIFKLTVEHTNYATSDNQAGGSPGSGGINEKAGIKRFRVETVADFLDHGTKVWRVEWNIIGTILASSGDDGKVRLWKAGFTDDWRCMSIISAEQHGGDYMER